MIKKYFLGSLFSTVVGLAAGTGVGYYYSGTLAGAITAGLLTLLLAVLEISLSFDNAVVNATVLKRMTPEWQHRFITWGILIAVFGMRIVFPLVIVSVMADISPWAALVLAASQPDQYAETMLKSHLVLSGFGGAFLLMVALKYFFDANKDVHWIRAIELPLVYFGKIEAIEMGFCLATLYGLSLSLPLEQAHAFMVAGIFGLITFLLTDGLSELLEAPEDAKVSAARASFGMFLYLEVLDASFSFDGVIGAFALTHNLFIIAIGLGVGAMFVRSMTIMLVDRGTLTEFRYLEHGAFYAIGALAVLMLLGSQYHIPEAATGLIGAAFIGVSFWSSIRYNRRQNSPPQ
ncbi:MAG: DUF475 domain-containing protein [Bdellovibrionales bacterium]|nr:DUF475 domain-containing protein [Bdellovibrionales bacterium]